VRCSGRSSQKEGIHECDLRPRTTRTAAARRHAGVRHAVLTRGSILSAASANGISLEYETLGNPDHPVILLIMGLGMNLAGWPDAFCEQLAANGFFIIRFDNRDAGLSTAFDESGVPNLFTTYLKFLVHLPLAAPYLIDDMAADTAALLDALGVERAHVVGASMGGMIAQNLAAWYPARVQSLTSMMSSTGRRGLPRPTLEARAALMQPPAHRGDIEGAVARMMNVFRAIGSPGYPEDESVLHQFCERHVRRAYRPAVAARQVLAIAASGDRTEVVRTIRAPTLVLHGAADPLVRPACGAETARVIPNARLKLIEGMGHDIPSALHARLAEEIVAHCRGMGAL
jgi:pimeloyl-ACP methyl ester carboxylesterase